VAATKTIAVDGAVAVPTGTWSDAAGIGIGALGRFEMPVAPQLAFSVRAGLVYHTSKDQSGGILTGDTSVQMSELPLLAGVRYEFTPGFYGAAELGFVVEMASVSFGGMSASSSSTNLGSTVGVGYRAGKLDVRAGLFLPDLGHAGDVLGVMATVGYDVASL
jgi:hypothetical protein